ncbi:outer membrane protein [Helicobacter sp. 11S03491-1]|uniref:outer membrane protein n=1 Tax=Helicobacter sp. 11S03491-1 TaxID=1476196 RepID=UPI000BA5D107|nr:outer membrane protein [Helicobacter sp. 11S03491-1]PAF42050.1 hypothetical protein BKH45_05580 [Helicobacter sp. 11S03491-1]
MKRILVGGLCSLVLNSFLAAEDSGAFLGLSYQYGSVKFKQDLNMNITTPLATTNTPKSIREKTSMNGAGIKIGYKQFFGQSKWFGLRYYAFLDYGYSNFGKKVLPDEDYYVHMLNYGVGLDTLWNLVNTQNGSFGLFVGVGVGGDTWIANGKEYQKKQFPNGKANYTNFQTLIDAGLRTNFHKHHGFELGVKIPLLQDEIFKDVNDTLRPNVATTIKENLKTDIQRRYSVYLSYLYTF